MVMIPIARVLFARDGASAQEVGFTPSGHPVNQRSLAVEVVALSLAACLIVALPVCCLLLRRRRRRDRTQFAAARRRNPGLSLADYERQRKLTASRLALAEDLQRETLLRKSLASRTTSYDVSGKTSYDVPGKTAYDQVSPSSCSSSPCSPQAGLTMPPVPVLSPRAQRPRPHPGWHDASYTSAFRFPSVAEEEQDHDDDDGIAVVHQEKTPTQQHFHLEDAGAEAGAHRPNASWQDHRACVDRTWRLLTEKRHPRTMTASSAPEPHSLDADVPLPVLQRRDIEQVRAAAARAWSRDHHDDEAERLLRRPPLARLKTPPLMQHPLFRGLGRSAHTKHTSLPLELARSRSLPLG